MKDSTVALNHAPHEMKRFANNSLLNDVGMDHSVVKILSGDVVAYLHLQMGRWYVCAALGQSYDPPSERAR